MPIEWSADESASDSELEAAEASLPESSSGDERPAAEGYVVVVHPPGRPREAKRLRTHSPPPQGAPAWQFKPDVILGDGATVADAAAARVFAYADEIQAPPLAGALPSTILPCTVYRVPFTILPYTLSLSWCFRVVHRRGLVGPIGKYAYQG